LSQVIVTNDELKSKREKSRDQERRIERESGFAKWRRNDITGRDPRLTVIGLALLPVVGLWTLLGVVMVAMLELSTALFRVLGRFAGGTKSLITGK